MGEQRRCQRTRGGLLLRKVTSGSHRLRALMLRGLIAMPGRLMYDGRDPDLFDHFAVVAQKLNVYTVFDYSTIIDHLVATWNIAARPVLEPDRGDF